jgi:hypothetical protein
MRTWQVERRKRTRHLIELGGLVVKAGLVNLTGGTILGALLWMADKLQSDNFRLNRMDRVELRFKVVPAFEEPALGRRDLWLIGDARLVKVVKRHPGPRRAKGVATT